MKAFRFLKILAVVVLVAAVLSFVVMHLWNWLLPGIVGWKAITYLQALGLLVLCKILFGGIHRHGGGYGWKRHMRERWAAMSEEEREKLRAGMRGRHRCGFGGRDEEVGTEPTAQ